MSGMDAKTEWWRAPSFKMRSRRTRWTSPQSASGHVRCPPFSDPDDVEKLHAFMGTGGVGSPIESRSPSKRAHGRNYLGSLPVYGRIIYVYVFINILNLNAMFRFIEL